jgi:hypothetical protein
MKPSATRPAKSPMNSAGPASQSASTPEPVNLEEESVAGEEDPGAALDLTQSTPVKQPNEKALKDQ